MDPAGANIDRIASDLLGLETSANTRAGFEDEHRILFASEVLFQG